jgi:hypothetical protein
MAICRVITQTEGWNVGDYVEPKGEDLKRLLDGGIVEVVEADEPEATKAKGKEK